jgi:hypothetical protein
MIAVISGLARWLQLASNMILNGGFVFFAIAGRESRFRQPLAGQPAAVISLAFGHALAGVAGPARHDHGGGRGRD